MVRSREDDTGSGREKETEKRRDGKTEKNRGEGKRDGDEVGRWNAETERMKDELVVRKNLGEKKIRRDGET